MKILLFSDTHLCHADWYGVTSRERMERLVANLTEEFRRESFEAIFMLGDYSLDYWECGPLYGSYSNGGVSNTEVFLRDYASRFPVPFYFIPGNHEQYTNEDWERITGAKRQFHIVLGDCLFFMLDTFGDNLNAPEHNHGTYSFADTAYIKRVTALYPGKKVFLCAHDFALSAERDEFKRLVRETPEIVALFAGHTHKSEIIAAGDEYGGKYLCRTGNYSYSIMPNPIDSMWGWRELVIDGGSVKTAYVVPENTIILGGEKVTVKYHRQDEAELL